MRKIVSRGLGTSLAFDDVEMPQRFVYNTSRLVVTKNHLILIAKIFVFKGPPQKYVGQ